MANRKRSEAPLITESEIASTDYFMMLDRSATTGEQAGPAGTWKQAPMSVVKDFGTLKGVVHNLNLTGIDLNQPFLSYIAEAINTYGPFVGNPGELMLFKTYQIYGGDGFGATGASDAAIVVTYYKIISGHITLGGVTPGASVSPFQVTLDGGPFITNPETNADLFIALGDIGDTDVEVAFNNGDNGAPWVIIENEDKIITATTTDGPARWLFVGGPGAYGGDPLDPAYVPATAAMFQGLVGATDDAVFPETLPQLYDDTVLRLDNHELNEVFGEAPSTATTFTLGDAMVLGGYDKVHVSTYGATEFPVIDDARAVLLDGSDFEVDSAYYMHVEKLQNRVEYWFEKIDSFTIITMPNSVTDDVNALWVDVNDDTDDADLILGNGTYINNDGWVFGTVNPRAEFGERLRNNYPTVKRITTSFKIVGIENASGSAYGLTINNNDLKGLYVSNNAKGISFNPNGLITSSFVLGDTITYEVVFDGGNNFTFNAYVNDVLIDTDTLTTAGNFKFQTVINCLANVSLSNIVQKIYL